MLLLDYMARKQNMKKKIRFRRSLFWDVDPKTIDPKKHARYIIERILELGTDEEVRWMWDTYPHKMIYEVTRKSRALSPQTRALWELLSTAK